MKSPFSQHPAGVALVVTLMMMSILVMMVVGLAGVMRNEQAAARNLTYQVVAEQMADLGAKEAMAAVLSNSTGAIGRFSVTGPGYMVTNGVFIPLFSSNSSGQMKNLEEIGTNSLIFSLPTGVRGMVMASWSNVFPPGNTNQAMGRYAWWVDDEGTKVNLNAVGSNNTNLYLPLLTNFPISADYIFIDPATGLTNAMSPSQSKALAGRRNAFSTVESLKDTNILENLGVGAVDGSVYRRTKGHVTAWSSNVDLTPWGTAKINLADPNLSLAQIKAALNTNALTNFFGANMTLGRKYGGGDSRSTNAGNHGDLVLEQIAANILAAAGRPIILSNATDFETSVAATSFRRHRNGIPRGIASHYRGPYLDQVRVRVDYQIVDQTNVTGRLGIWVRVVNPWDRSFDGWSLKIQPRKWKYVTKLSSGNVNWSDVSVTFGAPLGGLESAIPHDAAGTEIVTGSRWELSGSGVFSQSWPLDRNFTSDNLTFNPRQSHDFFFTNQIKFTLNATNSAMLPLSVTAAYVILDQVCLYEANSPSITSLRDWLTHDDIGQTNNHRTSLDVGQFDFDPVTFGPASTPPINVGAGGFPALTTNLFDPAISRGVRRLDPQVRFPLRFWQTSAVAGTLIQQANSMGTLRAQGWPATVRAWTNWTGGSAFNFTNTNGSVTGLRYLWPDPAPGVTDVLNHPHFVAGYRPTNGFKSVAQLGAIHTGIPWRTLRFQPQPAVERTATNGATNSPPDWILLDIFTSTNPTNSRTMINPNSVPMALGGVATNANGSLPSRVWAMLSAMAPAGSALSRNDTNLAVSNGVPVSLTNSSSAYTNLLSLGSNLVTAVSNSASVNGWSTVSGWPAARLANPAVFSANSLVLAGEILEIRGVAEDSNFGEDVVEGRLRSFMDMATPRSDTFSVWSVGQGLAVNTNRGNRTNVTGEVRKQTVFQRVPQFDAATNLTGYQLKVLYTRNHVVE